MKKLMCGFICLAMIGTIWAKSEQTFTGRPKILVVDAKSGKPIRGAEVFATFKNPPRKWGQLSSDEVFREYTDSSGRCSFKGQTWVGEINCNIKANGFYPYDTTLYVVDATSSRELVFAASVVTCKLQRVTRPPNPYRE